MISKRTNSERQLALRLTLESLHTAKGTMHDLSQLWSLHVFMDPKLGHQIIQDIGYAGRDHPSLGSKQLMTTASTGRIIVNRGESPGMVG